ncbi:MAG: hypothetical protein M1838_000942 [Thelocarpon superellum]|nr:MAG: hypothetical protein M1838_000942 [Thelocarpon superellum]
MPLLLLSGYPSSGKTYRATQLQDFFTTKIAKDPHVAHLTVHLLSDRSLGLSREIYRDARAEKDGRATEYSAIKRALTKDTIVIADGLNYIKGFRYQLYCEAKAMSTPSCVVHIGTPVATARVTNQRLLADTYHEGGYPEDVFENLVFRYEEPNGMTRWDSPLFTVLYDDPAPPCEEIWEALVGSEGNSKAVKPNQATVLVSCFVKGPLKGEAAHSLYFSLQKPATDSNHLYELDRLTQEILTSIISYQSDHPGEDGGEVRVPDVDAVIALPPSHMSLPQLQRMRRQFITMNRQHVPEKSRITPLFVDYLNDQFQS